jgi:hypothetical protein
MKAAPLSYAQSLRVIGESLEVQGISAFDLEKQGENYMQRVIVSQPARAASLKELPKWCGDLTTPIESHPIRPFARNFCTIRRRIFPD